MLFSLMGSLGLFLLGMWLMTEGLKLAGGRALETLLGQWTSSRLRGLATGVLITALVQSSSAVTVATLGFVNAGLMTFQRALWVVFGSNVGTTATAWLVTFFGFSMKIDALTFPLIGVGAALRTFAPYERGRSFGMALAGFGLLFMGIDALQENFSGYAHQINIEALIADSGYQTLLALGIGFTLTLLTQSSSAAIAIILTAVVSGIAGVNVAAGAVIGANIGTTSTAVIASLGATANAKRLAWAHVVFNLVTGLVALLLLPLFLRLVGGMTDAAQSAANLTIVLALFHTCFNLLGVLLMWPLEPPLARWLLTLYSKPEPALDSVSPLDANVASVPDIAVRAVSMELQELLQSAEQLQFPGHGGKAGTEAARELAVRLEQVNEFIPLTLTAEMTEAHGNLLTAALAVSHNLHNACTSFGEALELRSTLAVVPVPLDEWFAAVNRYSHQLLHGDEVLQQESLAEFVEYYRQIKARLLTAAIAEKLQIPTVDAALQAASLARRFIEQLNQASDANRILEQRFRGDMSAPEEEVPEPEPEPEPDPAAEPEFLPAAEAMPPPS